jgi:predicted Zn-dependent peptidase
MIHYEHFTLANGLNVYFHQDITTPIAAMNIIYNVGSKDEDETKTGFAHLFEHLMFGGSKNIPSYDNALQIVGGENNAFTSPDITNYYITLPVANLETAFWLESDRMLSLSFDSEVLEVQRKVVIEEFKQRYLNQPYGDVWLRLRPLAYHIHPYKWATIGKDISHIEQATMDDVKSFFFKYYVPANATLVVAGNTTLDEVKFLSEKWFGDIPAGYKNLRNLPVEPTQTEARFAEVNADVPLDAIYKTFHMPGNLDPDYPTIDLLSDVLGRGKSSRLYVKLVKEQHLFNSLNAHVSGSVDPGLFIIQGNLNKGVSIEEGEKAINEIIEEIKVNGVPDSELEKVKNKAESTLLFSEVELLNRAMKLAAFANQGKPEEVNLEAQKIQAVKTEAIKTMANTILTKENSTTLYYRAKNTSN